jgi:DNA-binding beta-propeller fold protein YncE
MKSFIRPLAAIVALSAACCGFAGQDGAGLYRIASAQVIKSATTPNWDYLAFDAAHSNLYIARRDDGILVYDTKARKLRGALEHTRGGNAVILVPDLNHGFAITQDGSATIFDLSSRKTLKRVKFGEDADSGTYDPVTKQVMITRGDSKQVTFLDANTGAVTGHLAIDSKKIEGAAPDGQGQILVALRDRNKVLRIDAAERKVLAEYPTGPGCEQPNGLAYDPASKRVFVGCRGTSPVLAVLDAASGRVVSTTVIGRGNDIVAFDAAERRIYTANGVDANMVVIDQVDADTYRIAQATNTRPNARTMALDPKTKAVYLVAAEGAVDGRRDWNRTVAPFYPNTYFKNTFTLLTLTRQ